MAIFKKKLKAISWWLIKQLPLLNIMYYTKGTQTPVTLQILFWQKILGINRKAYWPVHFTSKVICPENVYAGVDVSPGYSPGCYIQAIGKVYIGDYTQLAPNVGVISANHTFTDSRKHDIKDVRIGKYCWLGMNSVVLPGVELGDFTIVAAGAVVTKSFTDGYCVIGGVPAKLLKTLDRKECIPFRNEFEVNGFVKASKFAAFRSAKLKV